MAPSATATSNGTKIPLLSFKSFKNSINGELIDTDTHRTGTNPATREDLANVPVSTEQDLDRTVQAAKAACPAWANKPYEERKAAILRYADAIEALTDQFADLLTTEQGKPTFQAVGEVEATLQFIRGLSGLGDVCKDEILEETEERKIYTRYTPLGVVAALVPWNFPIQLMLAKVVPALLTGNTIIVKPSPFTPYCDLKLAELAQFFFPRGVVQCLSGDDNLGPWITSHPTIDKISFTGSTATGKLVAASAAKTLKRVTLELGGNDPAIVCEDVDIPATAAKISNFAFFNSGQICVALKRVYIHESIYEQFRDAMVAHTKSTITVGNGKTNAFCGPIQNKLQYQRVQGYFAEIEKEKQTVAYGSTDVNTTGYFVNPTIIDNPCEDSRLVVEEPFGPILPIMSWKDDSEVIARANNSRMGLGASVWTRDLARAERIGRQLESGTVWINKHLEPVPFAPFGGHKESGIGIEYGIGGLQSFCNIQTVNIGKIA